MSDTNLWNITWKEISCRQSEVITCERALGTQVLDDCVLFNKRSAGSDNRSYLCGVEMFVYVSPVFGCVKGRVSFFCGSSYCNSFPPEYDAFLHYKRDTGDRVYRLRSRNTKSRIFVRCGLLNMLKAANSQCFWTDWSIKHAAEIVASEVLVPFAHRYVKISRVWNAVYLWLVRGIVVIQCGPFIAVLSTPAFTAHRDGRWLPVQ